MCTRLQRWRITRNIISHPSPSLPACPCKWRITQDAHVTPDFLWVAYYARRHSRFTDYHAADISTMQTSFSCSPISHEVSYHARQFHRFHAGDELRVTSLPFSPMSYKEKMTSLPFLPISYKERTMTSPQFSPISYKERMTPLPFSPLQTNKNKKQNGKKKKRDTVESVGAAIVHDYGIARHAQERLDNHK